MMRFSMQVNPLLLDQLRKALAGLPPAIEKGVLRHAGRKGAQVLKNEIKQRTPTAKKQTKQSKLPHLRDTVAIKQKSYRKKRAASVLYFAVGWKSPQKPNAHLVEQGTSQRFTGSRTEYKTGESKKIKTKKGWVFKRVRKSIGSRGVPGAVRVNRGIMPAFAPVEKSRTSAEQRVRQMVEQEIRAKLAAELRSMSVNEANLRSTRAFARSKK